MSFLDVIRGWFRSDEGIGSDGWISAGNSDVNSSSNVKETKDNIKEIKELAVRLALSGNGLDKELKRIENVYKNKEQPLNEKLISESAIYDEQITQSRDDISEQKSVRKQNTGEIETLKREQKTLQETIASERNRNNAAWHEVLKNRFEKGKDFFANQYTRITDSLGEDWDHIKNAINKQFEIEREIHKIQTENYESSKEELNRRAAKCEEEQKKVDEQIDTARERIDALKTVGITRYSANFLLIAGIISLAGSGSVVANLLQGRSPGEDLITWFINSSTAFVNSLFPPAAQQYGIIKPAIFALLVLGFLASFYGLIILTSFLVGKFDTTWKDKENESDAKGDNQNRRRNKKQRKNFPGNLEEFVRDYQGIKSYFDFIPLNIERKDYTRLIASFPYIFLIATIIFLLSGRTNGNNFTLATAYIGIIVVLLTTSCCVIYVTKIIEPRWLAYAEQKNKAPDDTEKDLQKKVPSFFRMNKEIGVLLILLVASLILAALLPATALNTWWTSPLGWVSYFTNDVFKYVVWGSLAIFVSLSSFGLAYGIVQHGLFHDMDRLDAKRQILRYWTEKYRSKPVIGSSRFYDYNYPDEWMMEQIERLHDVEDSKTWYEMNEIFGEDYEYVSSPDESNFMSALGKKLLRRKRQLSSLLRRKTIPVRELRLTDFDFGTEAAKEYLDSRDKISVAETKIRENEEKISEKRSEILSAKEQQKVSQETLTDLVKKKSEARAKTLEELNALREERERELMVFTAAYTVGSVANKLLKDEDILSSEIVKVGDSDDESSILPVPSITNPHPLPAQAYWKFNSSLVKVVSYEGFRNEQRFYKIQESESLIPERELNFLDEFLANLVNENN